MSTYPQPLQYFVLLLPHPRIVVFFVLNNKHHAHLMNGERSSEIRILVGFIVWSITYMEGLRELSNIFD